MSADRLRAWELVLTELERAAALGADQLPEEWEPPSGIGPIPRGLEARARAVLVRLDRARADVGRRRAEVVAELAALDEARAARRSASPSIPVYLDISA